MNQMHNGIRLGLSGLNITELVIFFINLIIRLVERVLQAKRIRTTVCRVNKEGPPSYPKKHSCVKLEGPKDLFYAAIDTLSKQGLKYPKHKLDHVNRFLLRYAPIITKGLFFTPLFPSVAIAQAALESAWGQTADKTLFGIKSAKGRKFKTKEYLDGKWKTIEDRFAAHDTVDAAVAGYVGLLRTRPWFRRVWQAKTPTQAVQALQNGRLTYATDPRYRQKISKIIDDYCLGYFDKVKELVELWRKK
jgi:hypothetical protein